MRSIPCSECESLLQGYLDGELSEGEARAAEAHLDECGYCRRHYRFERAFRAYLRDALRAEPMSPELKIKLVALRSAAQPGERP